jgi:hypothetical protein
MNTEALFLFLILLLGLVVCSFLGGICNREGLTNNTASSSSTITSAVYNGPNGDTAVLITNADGSQTIQLTQTSGSTTVVFTQSPSNSNLFTNPFGFTATLSNGNIIFTTPNNSFSQTFTPSNTPSTSTPPPSNTPSTSSFSNYFDIVDNYNHFTGSGSSIKLQNGMVFTDASGDTVTVIVNSDGTQSLQLSQVGQTTPMILSSTPPKSSQVVAAPNTFYAPYGSITATVITGSNGQLIIQFKLPNGQIIIFTQPNTNTGTMSSTQYYGSTGYSVDPTMYSTAYNSSANAITGPQGNTAFYAQGPNGNAVAGVSSSQNYGNTYYSTLPPGIPSSQIPSGQEDLYILKSEIVPPVCPMCPAASSYPRQEKCPPCPACARCPEPSFECKKVPNYNAINSSDTPNYGDIYGNSSGYGSGYNNSYNMSTSSNDQYLPQPVLSDFSQF